MSKRFNIKDELEKLYIEIPKALLYEPKYKSNKKEGKKGLSNDAKLLYGILLDRTYLSMHNAINNKDESFIDENGDLFIYFDNTSIENILNVSGPKARGIKKELIFYSLLEEVQQGLGKANRLYLNKVEVNKDSLTLFRNIFQKSVSAKKETERKRIEQYRKDKAESIENTKYEKKLRTSTKEIYVPVRNDFLSSDKEYSDTDFSNTDLKSVVVINGIEKELTKEYKIQIDKNKNTLEKINDLRKITFMNKSTKALIHKFIDFNILLSKAQIKMLNDLVYDVAIKALDETIAKSGQTFSYFYEIYKTREAEDIDNFANNFLVIPELENKENTINEEINLNNSFEAHMYNKCVEFGWDVNTLTVQASYKNAIEYAKANNLEYPKNLI